MSTIFWPTANPRVTEEAGTRGGTHTGIDLAANRGDPVLAAVSGVAVYVGGDGASGRLWLGDRWLYPNGQGRTVDIRRDDGLISRVGHLDGYAIKQGDRVTAGQVVGYAGDSGYSTGVHIHWELRWDRAWTGGRWINPRSMNPALPEKGADDMDARQNQMLEAVYAAIFGPRNLGDGSLDKVTWVDYDRAPKVAHYGILDIDIYTQALVAKGFAELKGQNDALLAAIKQLAGGGGTIDMAALTAAAEKGAKSAFDGLVLRPDQGAKK